MENPHHIFILITACSLVLTFTTLLLQDAQSVLSMLTVLLPATLILLAVLIATRKFWTKAHSGGI